MAHYKGAAKEAGRALNLIKKRQKEQQELEVRKRKIEEELAIGNIHNKFAAHYDAVEQKLKSDTIGLVTLDQMKAKQEDVVKARERQIAVNHGEAHLQVAKGKSRKSRGREAKQRSALSFDMDEYDDDGDDDDDDDDNESDEEEEEEEEEKEDDINYNSVPPPPIPSVSEQDEDDFSLTAELQATMKEEQQMKKRRLGKNPDVDTSFLPDRDREEADAKLREELRQEWVAKQERIKNEEIDITYSYWDGSGHRRSVRMRKGNTMNQFLHRCLEQLRREFHELKTASVDQLMYVKEDLIIPHHNSFYDFIVTKARGKSGPLFNFDVHDDVRIISDATIEKDESHAGKVCLRSWYERNKHIFPASRWEPYDPEKKWDKYTVSDKESAKIIVK